MSWDEEDLMRDDAAFDELVSARLRGALDTAGPSHEAEERMLANLLAARDEREAAGSAVEVEPIGVPEVRPEDVRFDVLAGGRPRARRRGTSRRLALGIAASVVAALVVVSVAARVSALRTLSSASADLATLDAGALEEAEVAEEAIEDSADGAYESAKVTSDAAEAEGVAGGAFAAEDDADDALEGLAGGALTDEDDPSYALAVGYPRIVLGTGDVLEVQEHDGLPAAIGAEWLEGSLGAARALSADGTQEVACEVFLLPVSDDGLYAVRYLEGGTAYAARMVE